MWGRRGIGGDVGEEGERREVVRGRERLASILSHHAQKPLKQFCSCVQRTRVRWVYEMVRCAYMQLRSNKLIRVSARTCIDTFA